MKILKKEHYQTEQVNSVNIILRLHHQFFFLTQLIASHVKYFKWNTHHHCLVIYTIMWWQDFYHLIKLIKWVTKLQNENDFMLQFSVYMGKLYYIKDIKLHFFIHILKPWIHLLNFLFLWLLLWHTFINISKNHRKYISIWIVNVK